MANTIQTWDEALASITKSAMKMSGMGQQMIANDVYSVSGVHTMYPLYTPNEMVINNMRKTIVALETQHTHLDEDQAWALKRMKSIVHLLEIKSEEFKELENIINGVK